MPTKVRFKNKSDQVKHELAIIKSAVEDIKSQGAKVIIGPINNEDFEQVKKYSDLIRDDVILALKDSFFLSVSKCMFDFDRAQSSSKKS